MQLVDATKHSLVEHTLKLVTSSAKQAASSWAALRTQTLRIEQTPVPEENRRIISQPESKAAERVKMRLGKLALRLAKASGKSMTVLPTCRESLTSQDGQQIQRILDECHYWMSGVAAETPRFQALGQNPAEEHLSLQYACYRSNSNCAKAISARLRGAMKFVSEMELQDIDPFYSSTWVVASWLLALRKAKKSRLQQAKAAVQIRSR